MSWPCQSLKRVSRFTPNGVLGPMSSDGSRVGRKQTEHNDSKLTDDSFEL